MSSVDEQIEVLGFKNRMLSMLIIGCSLLGYLSDTSSHSCRSSWIRRIQWISAIRLSRIKLSDTLKHSTTVMNTRMLLFSSLKEVQYIHICSSLDLCSELFIFLHWGAWDQFWHNVGWLFRCVCKIDDGACTHLCTQGIINLLLGRSPCYTSG